MQHSLTLNGRYEFACDEAKVPPAAKEDLNESRRHANQRHDDAADGQIRDVHVARLPIPLATQDGPNHGRVEAQPEGEDEGVNDDQERLTRRVQDDGDFVGREVGRLRVLG